MDREQARRLLDILRPEQVEAVGKMIEGMVSPQELAMARGAPDDEPVTEEDIRRIERGKTWFAENGGGIPMEEVMADLGFTMEDLLITEEQTN